MTTLGNFPPHNPSDMPRDILIHRRANAIKYCWYHGSCYHAGCGCTRKIQGRKDAATFTKKMSGSTSDCQEAAVTPPPASG